MLAAVPPPRLKITSTAVERALADAEALIATTGPASAVDRAHTAFHGYLLVIANDASITVTADEPVTAIFKALRSHHPRFREAVADKHIQRVLFAAATIVDALDFVRNRRTLAHSNATLLDSAGAMLMINAARTLLHYLNAVIAA